MEAIKQFFRQFTRTTPFVLANIMIVVPYLLFIHLLDFSSSISALPFVLFYTFRMTGIFLIRGLHRAIDQYTLLMVALLLGGVGSFLTLAGAVHTNFYLLGSTFLGLSASWLTPANTSVTYLEREKGYQTMTTSLYLIALIVLLPLFLALTLAVPVQTILVPIILGFYYICAYHTVKHYPHYELDFKELTKNVFSVPELMWFLLFFVALFLLRSGRAFVDETLLSTGIFLFAGIFILALLVIHRQKDHWKVPLWQNALTFLNGMFGNFIFLFGTFYVAVFKGISAQATLLFLPYLLGVIASLLFAGRLRKRFSNPLVVQLVGLAAGLVLLSLPQLFPIAIFVLTFFQNGTSSWLSRLYYQTTEIEKKQRITAKFSTSNKGSITHQFLLMIFMLIALQLQELPAKDLLLLNTLHNSAVFAMMNEVKFTSIVLLLLGLLVVGRMGKNAFGD
ncbi:hypothetical protein [Enterococcus sp. DIV0800]|uniref:hypothetical protein n=1 Tax=unclassified Enterococcus TaxID=2608891 RepID=UPI003D2FFE61